ncbi:MAG: phosphoribosylformylglycinamidine synthase subunit PurL [Alphaproteobacteria bacterium]|jgi:phosphoribosylformylglycinamidine synthase|nr:phosphoribosylformylglycinamidine synthase subunit PurL [Alphaproteobacteria bacterium]
MADPDAALPPEPPVTPALAAEHGLTTEEYDRVLDILGRTPTLTELGIFSVMWSEHCSYKSSRRWLKQLPTAAPWVIQGPGENAGVIDIGDGLAAVFKMESHNHPSFIEPYQGAATGVGGILRDVFTMGARPVANLNALSFGAPEHEKTRHLIGGVVAGIGGYGNCIGVPTVGGEVRFHPAYNGNILVNAMTVGIAPADRIFYAAAGAPGSPVVYVGAKTGRDGIHGATMASAEFSEDSEEKRPTVQVGDPFTEKLLLEACLELMATDAILAIQDMGAAGLTSSSVEMADKGGTGIALDLDRVPQRETGMSPYEIMLSESQERMLMVLKPGREDAARAIFEKWELDFAVIGAVNDSGRLVLRRQGKVWADMPVRPLVDQAPVYDRPTAPTPPRPAPAAESLPPLTLIGPALRQLIACPDLASRRWIWEQYDSTVMADTMRGPGAADAAIVRVHGTGKALALTTDCTPRYCFADPVAGGRQAVAEAWRNLSAVGATPLAITDNMNFGNPEKPLIMGQFAGCIAGMAEACRALDFPVVSGNVSLYNETSGEAILPTPTIGGVGLLADAGRHATLAFKAAGEAIVLLGRAGPDEKSGHLGCSLYLREILGREDGPPPPVDLAAERRAGELVRTLIQGGTVSACHDVSDGGVLVALAEMAMAGGLGADLTLPDGIDPAGWLFGEDQGRYLVTAALSRPVLAAAEAAGVPALVLGTVGGSALTGLGSEAICVASLRDANESWLPALMAGTL